MARRLGIVVLSGALAACGLIAGIEDIPDDPPASTDGAAPGDGSVVARDGSVATDGRVADTDGGPALPDCTAQRVVHLVAGSGALAWFTQVWAIPVVVEGSDPAYAIDDRTRFASLGTAAHPLYVRTRGPSKEALWATTGRKPMPSAFVSGMNQTHTTNPTTTLVGSSNVVAYATAAQRALAPKFPAFLFGGATMGAAPGSAVSVAVADVQGAVTTLVSSGLPRAELTPSPAKLATWYAAGAPAKTTALAEHLLFTANAFRLNGAGTVVIPTFNDDPHGAFGNGPGPVTTMADDIASILQKFYEELATAYEPSCGYGGARLSLADNTVLVVSGDTFKNPFSQAGWSDGTPGASNVLYVRSNGYLVPGWFGSMTPTARINFDPATGAASSTAANADATNAAVLGLAYAISRGNVAYVSALSAAPYRGVTSPTPP